MNVENLYREACDVKFAAVYDMAENSFSLRWREHYEDLDEADFFGNQVLEGQSLGFLSHGVNNFKTSIKDHVYLGELRSLKMAQINERIEVDLEYMHDSTGVGKVSFTCSIVFLEVLEHDRIARHTVSMA